MMSYLVNDPHRLFAKNSDDVVCQRQCLWRGTCPKRDVTSARRSRELSALSNQSFPPRVRQGLRPNRSSRTRLSAQPPPQRQPIRSEPTLQLRTVRRSRVLPLIELNRHCCRLLDFWGRRAGWTEYRTTCFRSAAAARFLHGRVLDGVRLRVRSLPAFLGRPASAPTWLIAAAPSSEMSTNRGSSSFGRGQRISS